ncbi:MAG: sigma-70 family RNA polymerase sigma factor [Bacteroidia bacterium]|nr:sigma-70 family RNA polymerase sigma factor [Bacteroidia bacterium]
MIIEEKKQLNTRETIIIELYKATFPEVASFVHKMGGSLADAKDIFQDALVIYFQKNLEHNFVPERGHSHYLKGISKHLWYKKFRTRKQNVPLTKEISTLLVEEDPKISSRLLYFLELSGKRCLDLLSAFYYEQLNMKEIAQRFGFSGERSATAQKYKCLEKIRNAVRDHELNKEDFYE